MKSWQECLITAPDREIETREMEKERKKGEMKIRERDSGGEIEREIES